MNRPTLLVECEGDDVVSSLVVQLRVTACTNHNVLLSTYLIGRWWRVDAGTGLERPQDLAILRHSVQVNGLTDLALTKLDILSNISEIPVCTGYRLDDRLLRHFPSDLETLSNCEPEYVNLPGWDEDISNARLWADLPVNAQKYIEFISDLIGSPIKLISVGPGREQIVTL